MEIFYLKVDQPFVVTWNYLNFWLEIVQQFPDAKTYIVCDNPHLQNCITNNIKEWGYEVEVIPSARDSAELQYIVENVMRPSWKPVAYAHLTTFLHARDNGYKNFWNIDADDLEMCAKPRKIAKLLTKIKDYANEHEIDVISMDVWHTLTVGKHWSFGVAYTNNSLNWIELLKNHCTDEDLIKKYVDVNKNMNVDWYFTYLREIGVVKLESFFVENLRIVHHNRWGYVIISAGLRYWQGGRCHFPVLREAYNLDEASSFPIPENTIKFDIGITPEESMCQLRNMSIDGYLHAFCKVNGLRDSIVTLILPLNADGIIKFYYNQVSRIFA